jgi:hypothetical protein
MAATPAAERTVESPWVTTSLIIDLFMFAECANSFAADCDAT